MLGRSFLLALCFHYKPVSARRLEAEGQSELSCRAPSLNNSRQITKKNDFFKKKINVLISLESFCKMVRNCKHTPQSWDRRIPQVSWTEVRREPDVWSTFSTAFPRCRRRSVKLRTRPRSGSNPPAPGGTSRARQSWRAAKTPDGGMVRRPVDSDQCWCFTHQSGRLKSGAVGGGVHL